MVAEQNGVIKVLPTRPPSSHLANKFIKQDRGNDSNLDRSVLSGNGKDEIVYISIEKIKAFKNQARTHFDQEEIASLASTIKEHGVRNPLTVLSIQEGGFEVISGERRLRAAKIAGLAKVPCIVVHDQGKAEMLALIENIQRQDLHPIELGIAYKKLLARSSEETPDSLATKLGVNRGQVFEYIKYATIPKEIAELIIHHNLGRRPFLRELIKNSPADMTEIIKNEIILREEFSNPSMGLSSSNIENQILKESNDIASKETDKVIIDKETPKRILSLDGRKQNQASSSNLVVVKYKLGKIIVNDSGLTKCSADVLQKTKAELKRVIEIIERLEG
jgi:ParB family chromosome partitioning protein